MKIKNLSIHGARKFIGTFLVFCLLSASFVFVDLYSDLAGKAYASSQNFAIGKTVSASENSYTPEGAVDGDINSDWFNDGTGDRWLRIDLGSAIIFNRVVVKHAESHGDNPIFNTKNFKIQASTDGTNFFDVANVQNNTAAITDNRFDNAQYRYVRLYITVPSQCEDTYVRIHEIEVYYEAYSGGSLALNKTVTASSGSYNPQFAVDGDFKSNWFNDGTGDRWLMVDLGTSMTFNRWKVYHSQSQDDSPGYNTKNFKLQKSDDGTNWTDVDTVTNNTAAVTNRLISPQNARYVRLYITAPNQDVDNFVRIPEFEIFNDIYPSSYNYYFMDVSNYYKNSEKCVYPERGSKTLRSDSIPSGRYVKIGIDKPASDGFNTTSRVHEFELLYNIAQGKPVIASHYGGEMGRPESAVDGAEDEDHTQITQWCSNSTGDRWLRVDLGASKTIARWTVRHAETGKQPASYNTRDFKLQASSDGINFTDVDTVTGNTAAITDRIITDTAARYWRLYITNPNQGVDSTVRVHEFEIYENSNLLQNKTCVGYSGQDSSENAVEKAVDGIVSTSWNHTSGIGQWATFDLGSAMYFNRVVLKNAGAGGGSPDNNTYSFYVNYGDDTNCSKSLTQAWYGWSTTDCRNIYDFVIAPVLYKEYAHDMLGLLAVLQGIVNRSPNGSKIFYDFESARQNATQGASPSLYWLDKIDDSGGVLHGKTRVDVADPFILIDLFKYKFGGLVLWDESVPSTFNVANTIAGVEDLLPVRYDVSADSLYNDIIDRADLNLRPVVRLNGKFTGSGTIWDSSSVSTGSKKCDAYRWAKERYIDTGKVSTAICANKVDAWTNFRDVAGNQAYTGFFKGGSLYGRGILSNDYPIRNKAFFFDLQTEIDPSNPHPPTDEPDQPLGADNSMLQEILSALHAKANGNPMTAIGFTPWQIKYSKAVDPNAQTIQESENSMGKNLSQNLIQIDADAPGIMTLPNTSLFQDIPLSGNLQQNNYGDSTTPYDPNKTYIMLYQGDMDSSVWVGSIFPFLWDKTNGRGRYPMSWPVAPSVAERLPMFYNKIYSEATSKDYFTASDSLGMYIGLGDVPLDHIGDYCNYAQSRMNQFDLTTCHLLQSTYARTGIQNAVSVACPDGVAFCEGVSHRIYQNAAYTPIIGICMDEKYASWVERALLDNIANYTETKFFAFRTIIQDPKILADAIDQFKAHFPSYNLTVVDQYAFNRLYKEYLSTHMGAYARSAASASSQYSNEFTPDKAIDGDTNSRWASNYLNSTDWFQIDLGSIKKIGRVKIDWEQAYATGYELQFSQDGTNWWTCFSTTQGDGGEDQITLNPPNSRYVRINCKNKVNPGWGYSIFEFNVYQN